MKRVSTPTDKQVCVYLHLQINIQQNIHKNTMSNNQQPEYQGFCFLYIRDVATSVFAIIYIVLSILILIDSTRRYKIIQKYGEITKQIKNLYIYCVVWCIMSAMEFIIDITYYYLFLNEEKYQEVQIFSTVDYVLSISCGFVVQGSFIAIAINLMTNILELLSQKGEFFPEFVINFYELVKQYRIVRHIRVIPLLAIIILLFLKESQGQEITALVQLFLDIVDSVFCFAMLMITYKSVLKPYFFQRRIVEESEKNTLKYQFLYLIATSFYRLLSLIFLLMTFLFSHCPYPNSLNIIQNVLFGEVFLQSAPMYTLIRVQMPVEEHSIAVNETTERDQP